jgi:hypothetical protein
MFWKFVVSALLLPTCLGVGTAVASVKKDVQNLPQSSEQTELHQVVENSFFVANNDRSRYDNSDCEPTYRRSSYNGGHNQGSYHPQYYRPQYHNSGHHNSGYSRSYYRPQYHNSGHHNSGYGNGGHHNSGHHNSGHHNSGYGNGGYHH